MLQYVHAYLTFAEMDLSDVVDSGITVTEISAVDQPIDAWPESTAAFVGCARRGPLNAPTRVANLGEFRRRFGGCGAGSNLGPAARQYFENGGRELYVVRVANNACGARIHVPAGRRPLVLCAVEPGSTERIRAAVDYDGIDSIANSDRFNLTLQRIDPETGMIVDQEIFNRLSMIEGSDAFAADRLLASTIARVERPYPGRRPDPTVGVNSPYDPRWIGHASNGTDGVELSDYDLIGSRENDSGLFSLDAIAQFDILYLPPPGAYLDVGPAAVMAAEMYCRQRGAILVVDPCAAVDSAAGAIRSIRGLGYASPNIASYFPRVQVRGSGSESPQAAGGALAGLLCKLDRTCGPWHALDRCGLELNRKMQPGRPVDDAESQALLRAGINVIRAGRAGRARVHGSVTLGRGSELHRIFTSLPVRRLCLRVINSIDLATRWAVFEKPERALNDLIENQISGYLASLHDIGAFASNRFVVQCDAGLTKRQDRLEHGVAILLVFHPAGSAVPISFTLHQTVRGCRVSTTAFAPVAQHCA